MSGRAELGSRPSLVSFALCLSELINSNLDPNYITLAKTVIITVHVKIQQKSSSCTNLGWISTSCSLGHALKNYRIIFRKKCTYVYVVPCKFPSWPSPVSQWAFFANPSPPVSLVSFVACHRLRRRSYCATFSALALQTSSPEVRQWAIKGNGRRTWCRCRYLQRDTQRTDGVCVRAKAKAEFPAMDWYWTRHEWPSRGHDERIRTWNAACMHIDVLWIGSMLNQVFAYLFWR